MAEETTIENIDTIYRDGIFQLSGMYVNKFNLKPNETLKMFCNTNAPLSIMTSVYSILVNEGELIRIEDLPQETKIKLWNDTKSFCPGSSTEKSVKLCKVIWVINLLNEK